MLNHWNDVETMTWKWRIRCRNLGECRNPYLKAMNKVSKPWWVSKPQLKNSKKGVETLAGWRNPDSKMTTKVLKPQLGVENLTWKWWIRCRNLGGMLKPRIKATDKVLKLWWGVKTLTKKWWTRCRNPNLKAMNKCRNLRAGIRVSESRYVEELRC